MRWLWLGMVGCLALDGPPARLVEVEEPVCDPDDCPGEYGCYDGACADWCFEDEMCKEDAICVTTTCELPCRDRDCPDGFACKSSPWNECETECSLDDDCRPGRICCKGLLYADGECDEYGTCFEP